MNTSTSTTRTPRMAADVLWDALCACCGATQDKTKIHQLVMVNKKDVEAALASLLPGFLAYFPDGLPAPLPPDHSYVTEAMEQDEDE